MTDDEYAVKNMFESAEDFKKALEQETKVGDLWRTPPAFFAMLDAEFHFEPFDPCSINPDGLRQFDGQTVNAWPSTRGTNCYYVNPPYSEPEPWIRAALEQSRLGKTVVMLLRVDTSTLWFHDLVLPFGEVRWIRGRMAFVNPKTQEAKRANFASMLAIFRPKTMKAV